MSLKDGVLTEAELVLHTKDLPIGGIGNALVSLESKSYVYLIKCDKFYKIGIAKNLQSRLNTLQTGNPFKLDLICSVLSDDARALEKELHQDYLDSNERLEWFMLTDNDVNGLKQMMLNNGGVVHAYD